MAGAQEDGSKFSFTAAVTGFHIYRRVWLPYLGQRLNAEREIEMLRIVLRSLSESTVTLELMRMSTIDL